MAMKETISPVAQIDLLKEGEIETGEEGEIVRAIWNLYLASKQYKSNFAGKWDRMFDLYMGNTLPNPDKDPGVNYIYSTIEQSLSILRNLIPIPFTVPMRPEDVKTSDLMNKIIENIWDINRFNMKYMLIEKDALIYGNGFAKVYWDETLGDNGDVGLCRISPYHIFVPPEATSFDDAEYVIYACNVSLDALKRTFPEKADKIRAGTWDKDLSIEKALTGTKSMGYKAIQDTEGQEVNILPKKRIPVGQPEKRLATFIEAWIKQDDGSIKVYSVANGILLDERDNPYAHGQYPFVKFVDIPIPDCFWGIGEPYQLEKVQENINKRRHQINQILNFCANPMIVMDSTCGIDSEILYNRPGAKIVKAPGTDIRWLQPAPPPGALFTSQELDKRDVEIISGVQEVLYGRRQRGIQAAAAIARLQEASYGRLSLKNFWAEEDSIRRMGELVVSLVQQFYKTQRIIRIMKENGEFEFITIGQPIIKDGEIVGIANDIKEGKFEVMVKVSQGLPYSRFLKQQQALELYKLRAIDQEELLRAFEWINADEVLKRMGTQQQITQIRPPHIRPTARGARVPASATTSVPATVAPGGIDVNAVLAEALANEVLGAGARAPAVKGR